MNIHEFQAKQLFEQYNIPVPKGYAVQTQKAFEGALANFDDEAAIVVKSQIHAGGRGKGTFKDGYQGGVKVVSSKGEALAAAKAMLGNTLVTHQTGMEGREVKTVYFSAANDIKKEYYFAILLDRDVGKPVIIASTEGGMDIETVAEETPDKIFKVHVDPAIGIMPYQARKIAFALGLEADQIKQMTKLVVNAYNLYWEKDASLIEINPLITTPTGDVVALDAKATFDDNALYRHPDIQSMRDLDEEDPKEIEASKFSLNYIALDGNIACMVNGAGLAMATMDIIKFYGGNPANFLDVGGGATEENVTAAFKIILSDPSVKGILVNIFGGIMKCDVIANGIIAAAKNVSINVPLVVRLEGTNVEIGKQILADSGLPIKTADSLADGAKQIVDLVK